MQSSIKLELCGVTGYADSLSLGSINVGGCFVGLKSIDILADEMEKLM